MECKFCGTENPDGATYCKQCGKRIDGLRLCKACGHANSDDAAFCNACGARLTDAPAYESPAREEVAASDGGEVATKAKYDWRKIVLLSGGISAIVGVFFALLFTFFVGLTTHVSGVTSSVSAGVSLLEDKANFWYFFKDAYTDIELGLKNMDLGAAKPYYLLGEYLPVVLGTVIAAATLVAVTVLSVLAAVRFGRKLAGKSEKDYMGLCIAAVMVYVLGTLLFLALMNTSAITSSSTSTTGGSSSTSIVSASIVPNGATTAGLVLSLLFLALALGCRIAVKGKELLQRNTLLPLCLTLGGIVLVSVLLSLAANVCCECEEIYTTSSMKAGLGVSPWYALSSAASRYYYELIYDYGSNVLYAIPPKAPIGVTVTSILTGLLQLALVAVAACALLSRMRTLSDGTNKSGLGLAISALVIAVAYLVLTIVTINLYFSYMQMPHSRYHTAYAAPIAALVFAVLYLALSITHTVLRKKFMAKA